MSSPAPAQHSRQLQRHGYELTSTHTAMLNGKRKADANRTSPSQYHAFYQRIWLFERFLSPQGIRLARPAS
jgi:hypothetical protein